MQDTPKVTFKEDIKHDNASRCSKKQNIKSICSCKSIISKGNRSSKLLNLKEISNKESNFINPVNRCSTQKTLYVINNQTIVCKKETISSNDLPNHYSTKSIDKICFNKYLTEESQKEELIDSSYSDSDNSLIEETPKRKNITYSHVINYDSSNSKQIQLEFVDTFEHEESKSNVDHYKETYEFDKLLKISKIYEILLSNFDSFALFLLKYKEIFEAIEFWYEILKSYDIYSKKYDFLKDNYSFMTDIKINKTHEIILFALIMKLYELIRNNDSFGNTDYFNFYYRFKTCLETLQNNYHIFLNSIVSEGKCEDNHYKILILENLHENLANLDLANGYTNSNKELANFIQNSLEKLIDFIKNMKEACKNDETMKIESFTLDILNLEKLVNFLKSYDNVDFEEFRDFIYNNYLVENIIKLNLNKETNSEENTLEEEMLHLNFNNKIDIEKQNKDSELFSKNSSESYLPSIDSKRYEYTLVLDLDETLVHLVEDEKEAYVQVRPYAEFFLKELSSYYELVIFTAATREYADIILNVIDKNNYISHKLYRSHTKLFNDVYIKDLSSLGREINKTFIIDNIKDNFALQPKNGLCIKSFYGDEKDSELIDLINDLKSIVINRVEKVSDCLNSIQVKMDERKKKSNLR